MVSSGSWCNVLSGGRGHRLSGDNVVPAGSRERVVFICSHLPSFCDCRPVLPQSRRVLEMMVLISYQFVLYVLCQECIFYHDTPCKSIKRKGGVGGNQVSAPCFATNMTLRSFPGRICSSCKLQFLSLDPGQKKVNNPNLSQPVTDSLLRSLFTQGTLQSVRKHIHDQAENRNNHYIIEKTGFSD